MRAKLLCAPVTIPLRAMMAGFSLTIFCLVLFEYLSGYDVIYRLFGEHYECPSELVNHNNLIDRSALSEAERCHLPVYSMDVSLEEQIDKLEEVSITFLDNYKNPCWYEGLPETDELLYRVNKQMFQDQAKKSYDVMLPIIKERRQSGQMWRLRCLPLVYVLGVAKCGTTDLWGLLTQHPHVVRGATKEPMYWNYNRWVRDAKLYDFLDLFDEAAETIRTNTLPGKQVDDDLYHPMMTVDMSVETLFVFRGTSFRFHDNEEMDGPKHTAAPMIKNLTPGAKIIVLVRNPTERLYSEYLFFNKDKHTSVEEFHLLSLEAINRMSLCLRHKSTRSCVYDDKYNTHRGWVRLVAGMYAPFISEWLAVFPHMKVIRTADYHKHRKRIYLDLLDYIGLDPVIPASIDSDDINNKGPVPASPMLPETQTLLDDFYRPFNRQLAALLNDTRFNFEDDS